MRHLFSLFLWTAVFLLIMLAIDQLLVRVPATLPAHIAAADFYRDLRSRVLALARGEQPVPAPAKPAAPAKEKASPQRAPASVEAVIGQHQDRSAAAPVKPQSPAPATKDAKPRYVYADDRGEIYFAETLAEIPEQFRDKARRLGE